MEKMKKKNLMRQNLRKSHMHPSYGMAGWKMFKFKTQWGFLAIHILEFCATVYPRVGC